jgi:hypothetical protein
VQEKLRRDGADADRLTRMDHVTEAETADVAGLL